MMNMDINRATTKYSYRAGLSALLSGTVTRVDGANLSLWQSFSVPT